MALGMWQAPDAAALAQEQFERAQEDLIAQALAARAAYRAEAARVAREVGELRDEVAKIDREGDGD